MSDERQQVETEDVTAAHPVWSSDNEAIKDEFRRLEADRDRWQRWHQRADSQAERFQEALETVCNVGDKAAVDVARAVLEAERNRPPIETEEADSAQ